MHRLTPPDYNASNAKKASSYLDLRGKRVLVVGCNRGNDCQYFLKFGSSDVHGVDVADDVGADLSDPRITYHRMSAENMDLPSDSFGLVYCFATMEHIQDIDAAFREMARVTRPGGYVYCLAAPLWNSRHGHHKPDMFPEPWIHLRRTPEQIIADAETRGLRPSEGINAHVEYMLSSAHFNKTPAHRYVEVCASLPGMRPVVNALGYESEGRELVRALSELSVLGYTSEELRATTHTYVGKKLP